ncbi:MAG: O-linked GlcNAc transferase [Cyclobacteriaceae bacterium]|nr:O-linked GlcNAc transferase [Cyclobacteriaceae bacterium]
MTAQLLQQYILHAEEAFDRQEWLEAEQILKEALAEEPTFGMAHNHLGWLYIYYLCDYSLAEMHLRLALKYAPRHRAPYLHMAHVLFESGNLKELEALLLVAESVTAVPRSFLHAHHAKINEVSGRYQKAIARYKLAIRWSTDETEIATLRSDIKRCRKKQWMLWW